jgi:hypothetical protein
MWIRPMPCFWLVLMAPWEPCALSECAGASPQRPLLEARHAFFYHLKPLLTQQEVIAAVGRPDTRHEGKLAYRMSHGTVVLRFDRHGLREATHYDPGDGMWIYLYDRNGWPSSREMARRAQLLSQRRFEGFSAWGKHDIRIHLDPAVTYVLKDGYIALQPLCPLAGASGPFADRIAWATVWRSGRSTVVYRLWDHWKQLRPADMTDEALARRVDVLRRYGKTTDGNLLKELGPWDSEMGSGVSSFLYWIPDGLITIGPLETTGRHLYLEQPGADRQVDFKSWLDGGRPAAVK